MNIFFSSMGNVEFGIPVLLQKMTNELTQRGHNCYYLSIINGKGIDGDEDLYRKLQICATRIAINEETDFPYKEYANYSEYELKDTLLNDKINLMTDQKVLIQLRTYLENIRSADEKYGIDAFVVWGMRDRERLIQKYALRHNKKIVFLEHGYFRPFTLTVDPQGINYDNVLPREAEFYNNINIDKELINFLNIPITALEDKKAKQEYKNIVNKHYGSLRYTLEKVSLKINGVKKNWTTIARKAVSYYQRMRKRQKDNVLLRWNEWRAKKFLESGGAYFFVPFQLKNDTQTLKYSDYIKDMKQFVETIGNAVSEYNKLYGSNIGIIFKTHPMFRIKEPELEIGEIVKICKGLSHAYLVERINTSQLINNSKLVVTINSTVGIEALVRKKPVVTLGKTFYNIEGITFHASTPNEIVSRLAQAMQNEVNWSLVEKFLYYIRFHYFSEIYYLSPDDHSIKQLVDRILDLIDSK